MNSGHRSPICDQNYKNSLFFPCKQRNRTRDGFAPDCVHHQPVSQFRNSLCVAREALKSPAFSSAAPESPRAGTNELANWSAQVPLRPCLPSRTIVAAACSWVSDIRRSARPVTGHPWIDCAAEGIDRPHNVPSRPVSASRLVLNRRKPPVDCLSIRWRSHPCADPSRPLARHSPDRSR